MTAHIVLFQPKANATDADRAAFSTMFSRACREISSVRRAIVGKAASIDAGYSRSFGDGQYEFAAVLEFEDRDGLVAYLQHPMHRELGRLFWAVCERTAIVEVDLWDARTADLTDVLKPAL